MKEFTFMGLPATVVIEVDLGQGRVLRVPVGDLARYRPDSPHLGSGELRIVVRDPLFRRLHDAISEAQMRAGP